MSAAAPLTSIGEWTNTIPAPTNAGYGALSSGSVPGAYGVGPVVGAAPGPGAAIPVDGSGAIPPGVSRFVGLVALMILAGYFDIRVFRRRYG